MLRRSVGAVRIDRLVETEATRFRRQEFFPKVPAMAWARHRSWLEPWAWDLATDDLIFCVQSFLLRTTTRTVLVDACVGDHKKRWRADWTMTSGRTLIRQLEALGLGPESVDYVVSTHMHADHVGWNTSLVDGRWVPTFENAEYLFSEREWSSWKARHDADRVDQIADSILPIITSGQAKLVDGGSEVTSEIHLVSTPGHTPGHVSVSIDSQGSRAVITGDVIHHPVQCREPEWVSSTDWDPQAAAITRARALEEWTQPGILVCTSHFPASSFGYLFRDGLAYQFVPDDDPRQPPSTRP